MLGGDCIVSFGGAAGQELAQVRQDDNLLVSQGAACSASVGIPPGIPCYGVLRT
jgi:cysteine sulfinate desulfinase/cysteine desulfurase-like protein